jgi:hypothetical protein
MQTRRRTRVALLFALLATLPATAFAQQSPDSFDVTDKLRFHADNAFGPMALVGAAAYAGALQEMNAPVEWKQGAGAYGKRLASTLGWAGVHSTLAFGLDSTLHQDPRYFRAAAGAGFWRRSAHALRGTILTRTDRGTETFSTWRVGSAYGAAFISNLWYPDRVNTPRLGAIQGSVSLGFAVISNLGAEFWPDIKTKLLRRK